MSPPISSALETPNGLGFALAVIMYVSLPMLVAVDTRFAQPAARRATDEVSRNRAVRMWMISPLEFGFLDIFQRTCKFVCVRPNA